MVCYRCHGDVDDPYCELEEQMPSAFDGYYPDGYDDGDQSGTHAGTMPRKLLYAPVGGDDSFQIKPFPTPDEWKRDEGNAASLTEKLIQAAVDYESGRCSRRELSEARAAVEAALGVGAANAADLAKRCRARAHHHFLNTVTHDLFIECAEVLAPIHDDVGGSSK